MSDRDEVFTIPARRCKRCGGLLTSAKGIRDGYGPCFLRKIRQEEADREMMKYQCSLFDAPSVPQDGAESPPLDEADKETRLPAERLLRDRKEPDGALRGGGILRGAIRLLPRLPGGLQYPMRLGEGRRE